MADTNNPVTLEKFESTVVEMPAIKKPLTKYDRAVILSKEFENSLKDGTMPFLPNEQGVVDVKCAYNMNSNKAHKAHTQLFLSMRAKKLGSPTGAFVTSDTIKKAQDNGVKVLIKKGEHGKDLEIKDGSVMKWFNASQLEGADELRKYLDEKIQKEFEKQEAYLKENPDKKRGGNVNLGGNNQYYDSPNTEGDIACTAFKRTVNEKTGKEYIANADTADYLGQVLAAMQTKSRLIVTPEQAELFKNAALKEINTTFVKIENGKQIDTGKKDYFAVYKMLNSADNARKKYIEVIHAQRGTAYKQQKAAPEQKTAKKNEPEISYGR